jgi:hypothetical protein
MRADLLGLEQYAVERPRFRAQVMAHKRKRILSIGPHVSLHFEDRTRLLGVQRPLSA